MEKMTIRAVIFDLDGTLANTLPLCIKAFRESVQPLINRSVTDEEIINTFGPSEEGTIMALAPGWYNEGLPPTCSIMNRSIACARRRLTGCRKFWRT